MYRVNVFVSSANRKELNNLLLSFHVRFLAFAISLLIEQFSNECRKTKTKAITLTNHNRNKTQNEPIRNQIKYKQLALSAGKRVRASHDWFWFYA